MTNTPFADSIEPIIKRREAAVEKLMIAHRGMTLARSLYIVTSQMSVDELEGFAQWQLTGQWPPEKDDLWRTLQALKFLHPDAPVMISDHDGQQPLHRVFMDSGCILLETE